MFKKKRKKTQPADEDLNFQKLDLFRVSLTNLLDSALKMQNCCLITKYNEVPWRKMNTFGPLSQKGLRLNTHAQNNAKFNVGTYLNKRESVMRKEGRKGWRTDHK